MSDREFSDTAADDNDAGRSGKRPDRGRESTDDEPLALIDQILITVDEQDPSRPLLYQLSVRSPFRRRDEPLSSSREPSKRLRRRRIVLAFFSARPRTASPMFGSGDLSTTQTSIHASIRKTCRWVRVF